MNFYLVLGPDGQLNETVLKMVDGDQIWFVPKDEGNRHYQMYLAWVAEGNTAYYSEQDVQPEAPAPEEGE